MKKSFEFGSGKFRGKIGVIAEGQEGKDLKVLGGLLTHSGSRGNVVMVRLSDEALAHIDELVEATLFSSRSECAAFLIGAGIESQKDLFSRLSAHTEAIRKLKAELRQVALEALEPRPGAGSA